MPEEPSQEELEAAHCWEASDRVPGRPEMTAYRRRMRLHQARWREAHGLPIGSQPIGPPRDGKPPRLVGSRIALDDARETGATFLNPSALGAARARLSVREPEQTLARQPLWADLLSSVSLCFNLFGDLAEDLDLADRAVHTWWPDVPGTVSDVRFQHSPGRLDPAYLGSLVAFDVVFVLDLGDGAQALVAVDTKYHEQHHREVPKPSRLGRYLQVAERSGVFGPHALDAVNGTELTVTWLEHLLLLSMLQHPSGTWSWGRYVLVFPEGNTDVAGSASRYRRLLVDQSTFASMTVEDLLAAEALTPPTTAALRERYLPTDA